jgi:hypothetical protein
VGAWVRVCTVKGRGSGSGLAGLSNTHAVARAIRLPVSSCHSAVSLSRPCCPAAVVSVVPSVVLPLVLHKGACVLAHSSACARLASCQAGPGVHGDPRVFLLQWAGSADQSHPHVLQRGSGLAAVLGAVAGGDCWGRGQAVRPGNPPAQTTGSSCATSQRRGT